MFSGAGSQSAPSDAHAACSMLLNEPRITAPARFHPSSSVLGMKLSWKPSGLLDIATSPDSVRARTTPVRDCSIASDAVISCPWRVDNESGGYVTFER